MALTRDRYKCKFDEDTTTRQAAAIGEILILVFSRCNLQSVLFNGKDGDGGRWENHSREVGNFSRIHCATLHLHTN